MTSNGWKWKRKGFRDAMKSREMTQLLSFHAVQARDKVQDESGLKFHAAVDNDQRRTVSARAWVGASSVDKRTGKPNAGLHAKQVEALKSLGW